MLKILLQFIALLSVLSSYSQVQRSQAVIIFANNDSLSVEIKNEQLQNIQTHIQYKPHGSNNFVTGLPEQITSVRFTDGRMLESIKTDSVTLLLLRLIDGYYNLYKIERNGLITYYIRHAEDTPKHLVETFTDKYLKEDGQFHMISNFEYIHELTYAMADNAKITAEINEIKFREDELMTIVKQYNEYKGKKYPEVSKLKKKPTKVSTGILINYSPFLSDFRAVGLGMNFDFYRNRPYQKLGLMTRCSFNILEYTKNDSYKFGIEIPIALSYKYLEKDRLKLYFLGGITSIVFFESETSYGTRTNSIYGGGVPIIGTGIDYKIKKSALRFEFSLIPSNFILAYIF